MSTQLVEHVFNVFVYDRNGKVIPGATLEALINGDAQPIAAATTRGYSNTPISVHVDPTVTALTLRVRIDGQPTQQQTVAVDVRNVTFTFQEIEMPDPARIPPWFAKAGYTTGAATLLYFMYVAQHPAQINFAHHIVLSLGLAMAFAFIGGSAAASGRIPFFKNSPVEFSVGGGIAVFIIAILVLTRLFPVAPTP